MKSITLALALGGAFVLAQQNQTRNLTPDGYWHNRYFAILSQSAYGDHESTCPTQSFTEESKIKNFPDSPLEPYTLIEEWGPTPSGNEGFSAVIPEMNKVVVVFKGNPQIEANLSLDTVPWSYVGINGTCQDCTMNAMAAQGYMEAKNATNNWELTRARYAGAGLVYAITGNGLGGMHALIHSVDYNHALIAYYSHNQGTPRTFNPAGVEWYNQNFNGEAGERAIHNSDDMSELIPASEDYAHAGTTFLYYGTNQTNNQPNWNICWPDVDPDALNCQPRSNVVDGVVPLPIQDHYHTFTSVTQCGDPSWNWTVINDFIRTNVPGYELADLPEPLTTTTSSRYGSGSRTTSTSAYGYGYGSGAATTSTNAYGFPIATTQSADSPSFPTGRFGGGPGGNGPPGKRAGRWFGEE